MKENCNRLGFWYPDSKEGYYAPTPVQVPSNAIFFFEALCILLALDHVRSRALRGSRVLLYTDNANTVDIFHSFHCLPPYNHLLKTAVNILIANDYSLCVLHIPGEQNVIADALSQVHFSVALHHDFALRFFAFHPPNVVGSAKWSKAISNLDSQLMWPGIKNGLSENEQLCLD